MDVECHIIDYCCIDHPFINSDVLKNIQGYFFLVRGQVL